MTSRATRSPASAARAASMPAASPMRWAWSGSSIHPLAGVLSAYGIGLADVKAIRETSWLQAACEDFSDALADAGASARDGLVDQGIQARADRAAPPRAAAHRRQRHDAGDRGRPQPTRCAPLRRAAPPPLRLCRRGSGDHRRCADRRSRRAYRRRDRQRHRGGARRARRDGSAYRRDELPPARRSGPALILDASSTTVVEPGWSAERADDGTLVLTRVDAAPARARHRHRGRSR